jgi:hypothetical protein
VVQIKGFYGRPRKKKVEDRKYGMCPSVIIIIIINNVLYNNNKEKERKTIKNGCMEDRKGCVCIYV